MKETRLQDTPTPGRKNNQEDNAMKKTMKYTLAALISISAALSCTKEMSETAAPSKLVYKVFGATSEQEKTSIDFTTPAILWSAGDELGVVADPTSDAGDAKKFSMLSDPGSSTASFGGEITEASGNYFFTYPYIEGTSKIVLKEANKSVSITTVLPSVQTVGPDEIYNGALITAGHCAAGETSVTMHPIGIFLKLGITGSDIASVKVYANSSSIISGSLSATYNMKNPASSYLNPRTAAEMSNAITLLPKSGTSLSEGNYYLCSRKGYKGSNGDVNGMTIKFTKTDGTATYLSQDNEPAAAENMDAANQTIDLGTFSSSSLNWKKQTVVDVTFGDGSAPVQPFTTDIPTAGAVDADYALSDGLSFHIKSATGGLNKSGLAMTTSGDYIELPALPGKKLKEVEIYTAGGFEGAITDLSGNVVAGASRRLYATISYTYIIPHSAANTRYRILTNPTNAKYCKNITGIKLYYSGNDSDIYVTTGTASLEGKTVTVTGNTIIAGDVALTDITCGLETSRDGYTWEQATSAAASASFDASTEVWQGVTYIRAWARVEGQKKAYGEVKQVATPTITLDFDFSKEVVKKVVKIVSTTDTEHGLSEIPLTGRTITGQDNYSYEFADFEPQSFSVFSHWAKGIGRTALTYNFAGDGLYSSSAGNTAAKPNYFTSIPAIPGYKLSGVEGWFKNATRGWAIVDSPKQSDGEKTIGSFTGPATPDDIYTAFYIDRRDLTSYEIEANCPYYVKIKFGNVFCHLILHYEKVTEASPSFANVVFSEVNL